MSPDNLNDRIAAKEEKFRRYEAMEQWLYTQRYEYLTQRGWIRIGLEPGPNHKVFCQWQDPRGTEPVFQGAALLRQIWRDMWAEGLLRS